MATTEPPLCVASNSDTVFLATLDDSQAYRSRPPAVVIYQSQKNPTSLASIQWTSLSSILVNGATSGVLPIDSEGYWCAADDSGAFAIISGVKNTNPWSSSIYSPTNIRGLFYTPPPPQNSSSGGWVIGGPAVGVGFNNVVTTSEYSCLVNSGQCSGYLYVLPSATAGAPSNFVFAMYKSSGYSFEVLDRTTKKFTTLINTSLSTSTSTPKAFGYTNNKLVTVTSSGGQTISLNSQGLPPQGNGTSTSASLDASEMSECGSNGKRLVFSTDGSTITKVATVDERKDAILQGVVPVPGPNGGASTWALAYSTQPGGLYGLMMAGDWEDQKAASKKAGIIGGVCAAIAVVLGVAGFLYWRRKKQQREAKKVEEPQYPDTKLEPLDGNTSPPLPGVNAVNGFSNAPILESPLPPLPPGAQSQPQSQSYLQQFPQQFSQSQQFPQQYPQQYSEQLFPQQFPQQGPLPGQIYETYIGQQHVNAIPTATQPTPFTSSQSFSAPAQPYSQQQPSPSTTTSTPAAATNAPSFNANAISEQQLQDIQFSSHPRPNVAVVAGGGESQNVNATSTSTPDQVQHDPVEDDTNIYEIQQVLNYRPIKE
ncbi:hypothetical protein BGZ88_007079, partial [Linnemannia elongata]